MIALTAINPQEYQKRWWFTYKSLDGSFEHQAVLPLDQIYVLPADTPATGYIDIWVDGYLVGDVVYSGWKSLYSRHYVTFQVPDYVYGVDLSYGHGISPLKPIPAETVVTPVAKATGISSGLLLLGVALLFFFIGSEK